MNKLVLFGIFFLSIFASSFKMDRKLVKKNVNTKFQAYFFYNSSFLPPPDTLLSLPDTLRMPLVFPLKQELLTNISHCCSAPPRLEYALEKNPNFLLYNRRDSLVNLAKKYLGIRYMWGGTTPAGFDCSGFAQFLYRNFGYQIPRMSGDQSLLGVFVEAKNAQKGDLVFYGYPTGRGGYVYTHTAIVYENLAQKGVQVIHATLWGIAITNLHFDPYGYCRLISIKRII